LTFGTWTARGEKGVVHGEAEEEGREGRRYRAASYCACGIWVGKKAKMISKLLAQRMEECKCPLLISFIKNKGR